MSKHFYGFGLALLFYVLLAFAPARATVWLADNPDAVVSVWKNGEGPA